MNDQTEQGHERLIHASLLAGAIGDSLGADIEFWDIEDISEEFPEGIHQLSTQASRGAGWFTDDTQMALWTAEGLVEAEWDGSAGIQSKTTLVKSVHEGLLLWLQTQNGKCSVEVRLKASLLEDPRMWFQAAPGTTCMSSLSQSRSLGAEASNNSKGCGTIMRVAPIALGLPSEMVWEMAFRTSALTHGHPSGKIAAAAWASILSDVLHGAVLDQAIQTALARCEQLYRDGTSDETQTAIMSALAARLDGTSETVETLGQGWVAEEALSIALYSVLASQGSFERGLQIAVTHSGDSDSTGAIAGNLLGLLYPDQVFEHRWSGELGGSDLISRSARGLASLSSRSG